MANLFGNLLAGATVGGASANLDRLKKESARKRQASYEKLLQEYRSDNIKLRQGLYAKNSESDTKLRDKLRGAREDKNRTENEKISDKQHAQQRQDSEDDYIRDRAALGQDRLNKVGLIGQQYNDLERIYGPEKAKAMLEASRKSKTKGGLTDAQLLKSLDADRSDYNNDISAQGTEESGHLFWKQKAVPPVQFELWIKENRPEKYQYYVQAGIFAAQQSAGGAKGTIDALLGEPPKKQSLIETVNHRGKNKKVSKNTGSAKGHKKDTREKSRKYSDVKIPAGSVRDFNKQSRKNINEEGQLLGKGGILDRRLRELRKEGKQ